jgi:hypothetical protein
MHGNVNVKQILSGTGLLDARYGTKLGERLFFQPSKDHACTNRLAFPQISRTYLEYIRGTNYHYSNVVKLSYLRWSGNSKCVFVYKFVYFGR